MSDQLMHRLTLLVITVVDFAIQWSLCVRLRSEVLFEHRLLVDHTIIRHLEGTTVECGYTEKTEVFLSL